MILSRLAGRPNKHTVLQCTQPAGKKTEHTVLQCTQPAGRKLNKHSGVGH